jgi:hypothetical protein
LLREGGLKRLDLRLQGPNLYKDAASVGTWDGP